MLLSSPILGVEVWRTLLESNQQDMIFIDNIEVRAFFSVYQLLTSVSTTHLHSFRHLHVNNSGWSGSGSAQIFYYAGEYWWDWTNKLRFSSTPSESCRLFQCLLLTFRSTPTSTIFVGSTYVNLKWSGWVAPFICCFVWLLYYVGVMLSTFLFVINGRVFDFFLDLMFFGAFCNASFDNFQFCNAITFIT